MTFSNLSRLLKGLISKYRCWRLGLHHMHLEGQLGPITSMLKDQPQQQGGGKL